MFPCLNHSWHTEENPHQNQPSPKYDPDLQHTAATSSSWPSNWDGSNPNMGNIISSTSISPTFGPGESIIIEIPWDLTEIKSSSAKNACLLARITSEAGNDPIINTGTLEFDVYHNNNIAMKNLVVIGTETAEYNGSIVPPGGEFIIANNSNSPDTEYDFRIWEDINPTYFQGISETYLFVDNNFWDAVGNSPNFSINNMQIINNEKLLISSDSAEISNLKISKSFPIKAYLGTSFYTESSEDDTSWFYLHFCQYYSDISDSITGGMHFLIDKETRPMFEANAGSNQTIEYGDITTLNAAMIGEPVQYNWYENDSIIDTTRCVVVKPGKETEYRLEVISKIDGYKDYDNTKVLIEYPWIRTISPNPATNIISIDYLIEPGYNSARFEIVSYSGKKEITFPITDLSKTQENINISSLNSGLYFISLILDQNSVETKIFIKQ